VDSPVWIDYFKSRGIVKLDRLMGENLACINELILTELALPSISRRLVIRHADVAARFKVIAVSLEQCAFSLEKPCNKVYKRILQQILVKSFKANIYELKITLINDIG
jgi:hypothetical protein